jgi:ankyrin repeat protein
LLDEGVPADIQSDNFRWSPLHYASRYGHVEILRLLLQKDNIDINGTNNLGRTALHLAVGNGKDIMVSILLGRQAIKVNVSDQFRSNPLNGAKENGYERITTLLELKGAVINPDAVAVKDLRKVEPLIMKVNTKLRWLTI